MISTITAILLFAGLASAVMPQKDAIRVEEIATCIRQEFASDVASSVCGTANTDHADRVICTRLAHCISAHHFTSSLHIPPCNLTATATIDQEKECATQICATEIGRFVYFQCTTHVELACQRVSNTLLFQSQDALKDKLSGLGVSVGTLSSNVTQMSAQLGQFQTVTAASFAEQTLLIQHQTREISDLTSTVQTQTVRIGSLSRQVAKAELALSKQMLEVQTELKADIYKASVLTYLLGSSGVVAGVLAFLKACFVDRQAKAREMTTNDLDKSVSILAVSSDTLLYKALRSGASYGVRSSVLRN